MTARDPLIDSGDGEFQSYIEDLEAEGSGYSLAHLDLFLSRVYNYYVGKGFFCIVLGNALNLVTFVFTIFLATFLVTSVDYSGLKNNPYGNWGDYVNIHKRPHPITALCVTMFSIFWVWQFIQFLRHTKHYYEIKRFYSQKLNVSEDDLQTIEWRDVSLKLSAVKRLCRVKDYMTVLDVAARIMRKENYLIALINKNLLNLKIPCTNKSIFTKTIEWSLTYALFNFVFDQDQAVRSDILDVRQRSSMAQRLRSRFKFMGILSLCMSPFIFLYLLVYFFFKYGEDLRSTPGSLLGAREWTPLARWKFREFNELPHYLQNRLAHSYKPATTYIDQFPVNAVTIVARFIAFISGAGLAVLLLVGLWDEEVLMNSEIYGQGPLWYAGILATVMTVCRSLIPDEHAVFEPEENLQKVSEFTHYWPESWKSKAFTFKVRDEFCSLFEYKAAVFLQEMLGVIMAPFILMFSLPSSAEEIIDFFRECTVEVHGVGFVCTFSVFNTEPAATTTEPSAPAPAPSHMGSSMDTIKSTNFGKLEKSMITFKANNPQWTPPPQGEELFGQLSQFINSEMDSARTNPTVNNFLQNSSPTLMSQSISMLSPTSSAASASTLPGGPFAQPTNNLDPKALAFLHKVHQRFQEIKQSSATQTPPPPSVNPW